MPKHSVLDLLHLWVACKLRGTRIMAAGMAGGSHAAVPQCLQVRVRACILACNRQAVSCAAPHPAQVAVDVPRTAPGVPFFHLSQVQKSLERILYIWGIRWAASRV